MPKAQTKTEPVRASGRKATKPRRNRRKAEKEVRLYQNTTNLLIARLPFRRLVRDIINDVSLVNKGIEGGMRIQKAALDTLQEAAEQHLAQRFEVCQFALEHKRQVTLTLPEMRMVQGIVEGLPVLEPRNTVRLKDRLQSR